MKMNKRRIRSLAKMLREKKALKIVGECIGFNMGTFRPRPYVKDRTGNKCGTACCIAGWTVLKYGDTEQKWKFADADMYEAVDIGAELLGIDHATAWDLFLPTLDVEYHKVSAGRAAKVLDKLADTGEVEW